MPKEDRDAAEIVEQQMLRDGVKLLCCGKDLKVSKTDGGKRLTVDSHGQQYDVTVDEILVGVGRTPNVEGIGLETVGVELRQERGQGERAAADDESQDLCGRRHLLALQIYPCRRCDGADRHSERLVSASLRAWAMPASNR